MAQLGFTNIQRLLPRHFKIIDLAAAGHDAKAIAETLQMSPASVGTVLRSPIVQSELARQRQRMQESEVLHLDREATLGKARSILELATEKAAKVHEQLLENPDPNVQLRAADKILDRVFGKDKEDRRAAVINISADQVQLLTIALKESNDERLATVHESPAASPAEGQSG